MVTNSNPMEETMSTALWTPSEERIQDANLTRYRAWLSRTRGLDFEGYADLWEWSVSERADFWQSLWDFFEVRASRPADKVIENPTDMLASKWFPGARLNFAQNLLARGAPDREALVFTAENGRKVRMTYRELREAVARMAKALADLGVVEGDRVAGFLPNLPQAVVAMLGATSLGAVWSSCSPDFGIQGVFDRFGQIEPRVLFTADGYFYNGKTFDSLSRVKEVAAKIPSIEKIVVIPFVSESPDISGLRDAAFYDDFLGQGPVPELTFAQLPFDHPVYILYSSGTTGVPKCIVHGAGGTLMQHLKELALHTDIKEDDRVFYFTTCGWMMWNWLVSTLSLGATVLLFDGNPFFPDEGALFRLADEEKMTVFGTSARYIAAVEKSGLRPREAFDLGSLKAICSTGSPLSEEDFAFVYSHIKEDVQLASIAGGTDLISCFVLGNPVGPVWPAEIQVRGLGMKVDAFDEKGHGVRGTTGELVCTASFPCQPIYFFNDPGQEKYRSAYFERYPGVWHHGDFIILTEHDGIIMLGRSDATLNPGGVRIGTAEIYRLVMLEEEVSDSIVVGQSWDNDVRVVLFVVLKEGTKLTDEIVKRIRTTIRTNATPRHMPAIVLQVPDIPRTISGKKVELAVRQVIHGEEVLNRDALANPEALEYFRDRIELRS
jgi:acetoacetyl-CoA synthetase